MTAQDYQRDYYNRRKQAGRCIECGAERKQRSTKTRCAACAKMHRDQHNIQYQRKQL